MSACNDDAESKKTYMTVECSAPEHLMKELTATRPATVWRGVGKSWYPLTPKALRESDLTGLADYTSQPVDDMYGRSKLAQMSALQNFVAAANSSGLPLPSGATELLKKDFTGSVGVNNLTWPNNEILETLGLAQHYGVPTVLLDWSRSPLVAAYFAARGGVDQILSETEIEYRVLDSPKIAVWALRTHNGQEDIEFVVVPTSGNPNLAAQSGLFSFAGAESTALEEREWPWCFTRHVLPDQPKEPALIKYELRTTWAPDLLDKLRSLNVTAATIFPGFSGAAEAASEKVIASQARTSMNRRPLPK